MCPRESWPGRCAETGLSPPPAQSDWHRRSPRAEVDVRRRGTVLLCVLGDCDVRRVEMAFSAFNLAEYGVWVSVVVYAFESGGAAATAVVAVAQLLPAALIPEFRSWWARGWALRGRKPLWGLGFEGL